MLCLGLLLHCLLQFSVGVLWVLFFGQLFHLLLGLSRFFQLFLSRFLFFLGSITGTQSFQLVLELLRLLHGLLLLLWRGSLLVLCKLLCLGCLLLLLLGQLLSLLIGWLLLGLKSFGQLFQGLIGFLQCLFHFLWVIRLFKLLGSFLSRFQSGFLLWLSTWCIKFLQLLGDFFLFFRLLLQFSLVFFLQGFVGFFLKLILFFGELFDCFRGGLLPREFFLQVFQGLLSLVLGSGDIFVSLVLQVGHCPHCFLDSLPLFLGGVRNIQFCELLGNLVLLLGELFCFLRGKFFLGSLLGQGFLLLF